MTPEQIRAASAAFATALQSQPKHEDRPMKTQAQKWFSWCAKQMTTPGNLVDNTLCRRHLWDVADATKFVEPNARLWIFGDKSWLFATQTGYRLGMNYQDDTVLSTTRAE